MKSYINPGLSNTGKCIIDLVMMPDRIMPGSRAQISWTLVKHADSGLAVPLESQGVERTKPSANLSVSGVPCP